MIRRAIPLLALLITTSFTALPQIVFEVHVVNSLTNAAMPGANVLLASPGEERASGRTDAAGVFTAHLPSSGKYLLTVTRRGYVMKNGAMGKMLTLTNDESPVTAELNPLGVVTGRLLDQFGDSVCNATVHIEDQTESPSQQSAWNSVASAFTNDLGEYRVTEVPPGEHSVVFEYQSGGTQAPVVRNSPLHWPLIGGVAFYPDTSSIEKSQKITVAAGGITRLNDARISVRRAVTIAGRITPAPAHPENTFVNLESTSQIDLHSSPVVQAQQINAKGEFRDEAIPGTYVLSAFDRKTGKASQPVTITAEGAPITGIELRLTSSYEITGRITVESGETLDFSRLMLAFGGPAMRVESDGSFHTTLSGGHAFLNLQGLPKGWYIKSAVARGKPIRRHQFDLEEGSNDVMISISSGGAHVRIVVREPDSTPEQVVVALIPESIPSAEPGILTNNYGTTSEPVEFTSVPPGNYRVFALDLASWAMIMRPDLLMSQYKNSAPAISLAEHESKTISAPLMRIVIPQ
jgi:hypothetical protein